MGGDGRLRSCARGKARVGGCRLFSSALALPRFSGGRSDEEVGIGESLSNSDSAHTRFHSDGRFSAASAIEAFLERKHCCVWHFILALYACLADDGSIPIAKWGVSTQAPATA